MGPEEYVYESPDGGDTVYRRRAGTEERSLVQSGPLRKQLLRSQLWRGIFEAAESDPELHGMIDRIEIYYRLKYNAST